MKINRISFLLTLTFLLVSNITRGQAIIPQTSTDSVRIRPFESAAITEAFTASNNLISESGKEYISEEVIDGYTSEIDTLFSTIRQFLADSTVIKLQEVSIRELESISHRATSYMGSLDQLQGRLSKGSKELEEIAGRLDQNRQRWPMPLCSSSWQATMCRRPT